MTETMILYNIGSIPKEMIEVTLFEDGELQFYSEEEHVNLSKQDVLELLKFLNNSKTLTISKNP
jgi:hypothetical protein